VEILAETGTFYSDSDNPHTIEEILYTTLQQKCFTMEDQRLDNIAFRVEEAITEERGGFIDHNESAPSEGRSPGEHTHYPLSWK
jgi:hypothetical protein